jgi:hypothetical protein
VLLFYFVCVIAERYELLIAGRVPVSGDDEF